jgi:hypothetical protein
MLAYAVIRFESSALAVLVPVLASEATSAPVLVSVLEPSPTSRFRGTKDKP